MRGVRIAVPRGPVRVASVVSKTVLNVLLAASVGMGAEAPAPRWQGPKPQPKPTHRLLVTAYCRCSICCGKWSDGITATGTKATAGRTIACDRREFPMGTVLEIEGVGRRVCEDTGSMIRGLHVDEYVDDHEAALQLGRRHATAIVLSAL